MQTIYTNEGLISNSIKQSFPGAFSTYISTFYNYNMNDTCQFGYASQPINLTSKNHNLILINKYVIDCKNINSGLISKGLQTSIIFIVEENRDIISGFNVNKSNEYYWINSNKFSSSSIHNMKNS